MIHWLWASSMIDDVVRPFGQCSIDRVDVMDVLGQTWSSLVARYLDRPSSMERDRGATRISFFVGLPGLVRSKSNYFRERPLALQIARDTSLTLESARDRRVGLLPTRLLRLKVQGTRTNISLRTSPTLETARDGPACFEITLSDVA